MSHNNTAMYLKVITIEEKKEKLVAICDKDLLGKKLKEGDIVLDLEKYQNFYKGNIATEREIITALKGATSINIVGIRSLEAAKKAGITTGEEAILINRVPHLQIYRI
ncbi:DUF424 domain-containing protein [Candidatus Micrarchaeota archaeon]|nr:DUF424 domain-containing protein [Candidatus Micrarchaeota archaeon]